MTPPAPAVSVLVPTYERPALLGRAVESVLAQTFTDFEVVVADNASGPAVAEVVAGFGDPRIRLERAPVNRGMAANHLRCLELARGRYFTVLQDDDTMYPESLARKVAVLDGDPSLS
ncbi:MAG: glycosyltransferase family 2 protein, partial [Acidimicrobiales bacterium]